MAGYTVIGLIQAPLRFNSASVTGIRAAISKRPRRQFAGARLDPIDKVQT
jgi:hypothetical protein